MLPERLRSDDQENQTPQQLQAELISVLELLPKMDIEDESTLLEESGVLKLPSYYEYEYLVRERRLHSGYSEVIMDHITGLVGRANITEHFRKYIVNKFAHWLEQGIAPDRDPQDIENSLFFLDRSQPESGGIFNPARAATLEWRALADSEFGQSTLEKIAAKSERWQEFYKQRKQALEDWKEQILQRYGEQGIS